MLVTATVTFWRWLTGQPVPALSSASTDTSADERRVWLRHAASLNVRCGEAGSEKDPGVSAVICDISRGGIQIIAPCRFEPGALLSVGIPSASGEDEIAVLACVVRAQPHGDSEWRWAVVFLTS